MLPCLPLTRKWPRWLIFEPGFFTDGIHWDQLTKGTFRWKKDQCPVRTDTWTLLALWWFLRCYFIKHQANEVDILTVLQMDGPRCRTCVWKRGLSCRQHCSEETRGLQFVSSETVYSTQWGPLAPDPIGMHSPSTPSLGPPTPATRSWWL